MLILVSSIYNFNLLYVKLFPHVCDKIDWCKGYNPSLEMRISILQGLWCNERRNHFGRSAFSFPCQVVGALCVKPFPNCGSTKKMLSMKNWLPINNTYWKQAFKSRISKWIFHEDSYSPFWNSLVLVDCKTIVNILIVANIFESMQNDLWMFNDES